MPRATLPCRLGSTPTDENCRGGRDFIEGRKLRVLDLFSGIGGFSLGLERAKSEGEYTGFETVAFCEIEEFPRRVLAKHWPDVPCYRDVRELTSERLNQSQIAVDIITGGFPCQDLSSAGKQIGIDGARSGLWSEICRLIGEIRPRVAVMENVAGLLSGHGGAWFGRVLGDLAALGYDAEWHCIPASSIGAPHTRDRVWIVAYAPQIMRDRVFIPGAFANQVFDQGYKRIWSYIRALRNGGRPESNFPRIRTIDGLSAELDAIAALGNAVVPQIPELIGNAILSALNDQGGRDFLKFDPVNPVVAARDRPGRV